MNIQARWFLVNVNTEQIGESASATQDVGEWIGPVQRGAGNG
jgi:hypothetical protein